MGVPIYAFVKMVPRSEYFHLSEEGRHQAWWKAVTEVGNTDASEAKSIVMCRGVVAEPSFLFVTKYADMDAYIRIQRVWRAKTHIQKYWDATVELGCTDDDLNKAFGETKAAKATW